MRLMQYNRVLLLIHVFLDGAERVITFTYNIASDYVRSLLVLYAARTRSALFKARESVETYLHKVQAEASVVSRRRFHVVELREVCMPEAIRTLN